MDARIAVEDLLGAKTGDAHVIRNAGAVVSEDAIRSLIISHHLLNTREIILIAHTRCGMLAFTDDLLRAGLEGDEKSVGILKSATGRDFTPVGVSAAPQLYHAFRGTLEALDAARSAAQFERLQWQVRRGLSTIKNHPLIPTTGPDAIVSIRGFVYDVDTGLLEEVVDGPKGPGI